VIKKQGEHKMKRLYPISAVLVLLIATVAPAAAAPANQAQDIVDIAVADGRFETLVAAVTAADLVDTLKGEGPFTVFAPTDDAFAALPAGTVEALLNDIPTLTDILLYHVVSGKVMAADVVNLTSADTVLGKPISISLEGDSVKINDATVIITDIEASNGVIHVIDAVLLPPADAPEALPVAGGTPTNTAWLFVLAVGAVLILSGIAVRLRLTQVER
jgi:uncharacterized surface protein with fasciclin (FAS1) repeats